MNEGFPQVLLDEVLSQYREYIDAPEAKTYPKLSVKLYGKGVTLDTPADGTSLKMQRHQLAKAGQVILSEIWGKKGAIGFVPAEGEDALCTSHFFLFDVRRDKLEPKYLQAIFTANYLQEQLDAEAKGTTGYAAVRPKNLLAARIPLPPLSEQRRIVARIDELAAKIEEAKGLRREAIGEADILLASVMSLVFDTKNGHGEPKRLEVLADKIADINHSMPQAVASGKKLVSPKDFSKTGIDFRFCKQISKDDFDTLRTKIQPQRGDILFSRIGTIGQARLVDVDEEFIASYSIVTIRPNLGQCIPKYLLYALQSPSTLSQAVGGVRGIAMPDLGIKHIRAFTIPCPPLPEQERIVAYLDGLQAKVDALKALQGETAAELNALLPSVLDRAFSGRL